MAGSLNFVKWLRDRVWATLDGHQQPAESVAAWSTPPAGDLLQSIYDELTAEMAVEADRRRAIEAKLTAASSTAPIGVTLMGAITAFITSTQAGQFSRASVMILSSGALYVSLQFLRATIAALVGLKRTAYTAQSPTALVNDAAATKDAFLQGRAIALANRIAQHRFATNERVSQLALAHASLINALGGLIVAAMILLIAAMFGQRLYR